MNVLVLGATGKTGKLVVERALAKGHAVTTLVRDSSKSEHDPRVHLLVGDATHPDDVQRAVAGVDAVIDTIGGTTPYKDTELERTAAHNVVAALQAKGGGRLVVISMMGIGESREQTPFWYEHLLMPTFLRGSTKDKTAMEQEVRASNLDFIIVRPPILKDDPAKGHVSVISGKGEIGHEITRADLANFLIDQLESDEHLRQAVTVVNR